MLDRRCDCNEFRNLGERRFRRFIALPVLMVLGNPEISWLEKILLAFNRVLFILKFCLGGKIFFEDVYDFI